MLHGPNTCRGIKTQYIVCVIGMKNAATMGTELSIRRVSDIIDRNIKRISQFSLLSYH